VGEKKTIPVAHFFLLTTVYNIMYKSGYFYFFIQKLAIKKNPRNLWFAFSLDEFTSQKTLIQIWEK